MSLDFDRFLIFSLVVKRGDMFTHEIGWYMVENIPYSVFSWDNASPTLRCLSHASESKLFI